MKVANIRPWMAVLILLSFPTRPLYAATVFGTVMGPNGPVAGAAVFVQPSWSDSLETVTDTEGNYSLDVPAARIDHIYAEPVQAGSGLIGEVVGNLDTSSDREVRLVLANEINISGDVLLPEGFEGRPRLQFLRVDKFNLGSRGGGGIDESNHFEATLAAGVYALHITPECEFSDFLNRHICPIADYFSYLTVDATGGSLSGLVIPVADPSKPLIGHDPPVASLIHVGAVDEGGIAVVRGMPGAVPGPSLIRLVNLQTGQFELGASLHDGSFEIPLFAPPGSFLEVSHDPSALSENSSRGAGTIIRVPPSVDDQNVFATMGRADEYGQAFWESNIASKGIMDGGQVWLSGELADRDWLPGDSFNLNGDVKIYSNDIPLIDINNLKLYGKILLERVFDDSGSQELAGPVLVSHLMTPSLLPIQRHGIRGIASRDAILIGEIHTDGTEVGPLIQTSDRSLDASWQTSVQIPQDVPVGVYSLVFEFFVEGLIPQKRYFENVFSTVTRSPIHTTGHAALVTMGTPANRRLSWVLGLNNLSNGTRGTIAFEDRSRIGVSGRVAANSNTFVLPLKDDKTELRKFYRLEPFSPLIGVSNRGWISTPTVPFKFPSGGLSVSIENPDGSITDLGTAPFKQPFMQQLSSRSGTNLHPVSNAVTQYFGLTTLDPRFDVQFEQYGRHLVSMTGNIEDILGTVYQGGGSFEVFVAKHLDVETGVFANTPFEVGDSFSPSLIVQPGVAADVEVRIDYYPQSDTARLVTKTISGLANRYGYFVGDSGDIFTFAEPGEYRVEYRVTYTDEEGVFWAGSETWGSVVETPNSPLITRGKRGHDGSQSFFQPQWFFIDDLFDQLHFFFPFASGDILWMLDRDVDPYFAAAVPAISIQDTVGDFATMVEARNEIMQTFRSEDMMSQIVSGQIPLLSSTSTGLSPSLQLDAIDTHRAYFYTGAARPGVQIRSVISEDRLDDSYWRFNDCYYYQAGNGCNGDLANDFKFQFGGAVYRAPDRDFSYYGAYGSLWVLLPDDDPAGGRLFPPFQGNGGGPSGGPIMTLKGKEIDMFLHPMGVRPGSILEAGDTVAFSGQVAPTLPTFVDVRITSPSGIQRFITGKTNKIGYFYHPPADFVVNETGVWKVFVETTFKGISSAGQVTEPYPEGDILGSPNGTYEFYVVEPGAPPLELDIPAHSWVEPGKGPLNIPLLPTDELSDVVVHRTTVMPGFLMEEADTASTMYSYDAPSLNQDFPNLDLEDDDFRYGADTVTMSFLVSGVDGGGNTVHRARQVLLQGEELMAPEQESTFFINGGVNDAWVHAGAANQGMFLTAFPLFNLMFGAWFTFDSEAQAGNPPAILGANDQRWVTALGPYSGTSASLTAELTSGGLFNSAGGDPQQDTAYGTIDINFNGCASADVSFNFPDAGESGSFSMNRALNDNVAICQGIVRGDIVPTAASTESRLQTMSERISGRTSPKAVSAAFAINSGMNDAWVNADAPFQGMFLTAFPELSLIFAAWFTFDTVTPEGATATFGAADQRWLTALGTYSGTTASLHIENTNGGSFNDTDPAPSQDGDYGTLDIDFSDCNNATVSYNIPAADQSGEFTMTRVLPDNMGLCEALITE